MLPESERSHFTGLVSIVCALTGSTAHFLPDWFGGLGLVATAVAVAFAVPAAMWGHRSTRLVAVLLAMLAVFLQFVMV
jgi:hypothetical protein